MLVLADSLGLVEGQVARVAALGDFLTELQTSLVRACIANWMIRAAPVTSVR